MGYVGTVISGDEEGSACFGSGWRIEVASNQPECSQAGFGDADVRPLYTARFASNAELRPMQKMESGMAPVVLREERDRGYSRRVG
jgi:hypothetical protein